MHNSPLRWLLLFAISVCVASSSCVLKLNHIRLSMCLVLLAWAYSYLDANAPLESSISLNKKEWTEQEDPNFVRISCSFPRKSCYFLPLNTQVLHSIKSIFSSLLVASVSFFILSNFYPLTILTFFNFNANEFEIQFYFSNIAKNRNCLSSVERWVKQIRRWSRTSNDWNDGTESTER